MFASVTSYQTIQVDFWRFGAELSRSVKNNVTYWQTNQIMFFPYSLIYIFLTFSGYASGSELKSANLFGSFMKILKNQP